MRFLGMGGDVFESATDDFEHLTKLLVDRRGEPCFLADKADSGEVDESGKG